ncbi:unnamed protein product [Ectocarpus sp. 8 AP-2014]
MQHMPRVSIVTPTTFSRAKFAPLLVRNILCQTYSKHLLQLIVVGDTDPRTRQLYSDVFRQLSPIVCTYHECDINGNIGRKRNFACGKANGKILAAMDDDDFYHKSYLEYAVLMMRTRKVNIVACRDMFVFFPLAEGKMTMVRGSTGHEATFVCTKQHWKTHKFAPTAVSEGASMIDGKFYNELDIRKVMICFSHGNNTYDKAKLLQAPAVAIPDELRQKLLEIWIACTNT